MAFRKATAPAGQQAHPLLSADNGIPERHIVIETVRNAAPRLGLSASVIATLDAMLSCLAPKRVHHTVFASNATLTFRRNGISDRTLRRHAAALQEAGLLVRNDSPNGKRFTKHSALEGKALRFGFDLTPLFQRLQEIAALAAEALRVREHISYLRTKIRAIANAQRDKNPDDPTITETFRVLRRKLSVEDCENLLNELPQMPVEGESTELGTPPVTHKMTASDGQNVRHHHKSNKEPNDKEGLEPSSELTVPEILNACPEAVVFALKEITTPQDVIEHARTLAPMIGITNTSYETAHRRLGPMKAAATVWAVMQLHDQIKSVGAYFHSITAGSKSAGFSPECLIRRLALAHRQPLVVTKLSADNT